MIKILLADDDAKLVLTVKEWLENSGYSVEHVYDGEQALKQLQSNTFDLIILDWTMPVMTGLEVCKQYVDGGGQTPILFLTANASIADKEIGFGGGADDYITKPFDLRELSVRVQALLRRGQKQIPTVLRAGNIMLDKDAVRVFKDGEEIYLARVEFHVLEFLLRHKGRLCAPGLLLNNAWPDGSTPTVEGLRTCINKLRQKIDTEGESSLIQSVPKLGYKIEDREVTQ